MWHVMALQAGPISAVLHLDKGWRVSPTLKMLASIMNKERQNVDLVLFLKTIPNSSKAFKRKMTSMHHEVSFSSNLTLTVVVNLS